MTDPIRSTARLLTGATYIALGSDAARAPGVRVQQARSTLALARRVVPIPEDDELVVRANGATMAVAGTTLALGVLPRTSAVVLLVALVPTTYAGHAFWTIEDPAARKTQRTQFLKNLALTGGLLFAVLDKA